jgi:hypothetical protein
MLPPIVERRHSGSKSAHPSAFQDGYSAGHHRVAGLVAVFTVLNANLEQNTNWSFLRTLSIVKLRLARLGAKLE